MVDCSTLHVMSVQGLAVGLYRHHYCHRCCCCYCHCHRQCHCHCLCHCYCYRAATAAATTTTTTTTTTTATATAAATATATTTTTTTTTTASTSPSASTSASCSTTSSSTTTQETVRRKTHPLSSNTRGAKQLPVCKKTVLNCRNCRIRKEHMDKLHHQQHRFRFFLAMAGSNTLSAS